MKVKVGFTAFLLVLLADLPLILGRKCGGEMCKVNENSAIPVDLPRLCGDNIMKVYTKICDGSLWAKRRRRRDVLNADLFVQTKHEAQDFLSSIRRKRGTEYTDVVEECCVETCRTEELHEYC